MNSISQGESEVQEWHVGRCPRSSTFKEYIPQNRPREKKKKADKNENNLDIRV